MNPKQTHALYLLCALTLLLTCALSAQISITKIGEYLIGNEAQPQNASDQLNLRSHQDDAIVSFNGYQYAVYYSTVNGNLANRYVTIGRRKLPDGDWETVKLTDYTETINDSHRVVSMGICEGDGTIHMAFDHHNNDLNYRISVQGLATNPEAHAWVASKFNPVVHALPGMATSDTTGLTYPRFTHTPSGDLQMIRRKGSAINGRSYIYTYRKNTHRWVKHGLYIDGSAVFYENDAGEDTKLNAYLHGVNYDGNGRLHLSWTWRTTNGKNFDLMYAYSDDEGITWKNNAGQLAGRTGSDPITYNSTPAVKVRTYAEGVLYNQTGQTVDSQGRVHAVQRKNNKFMHLYRNTSGQWIENTTNLPQGRYKLTVDQHDNLYYITSSARVYVATPANDYQDWEIAYNGDFGDFAGDPHFDEYRMRNEGILSILVAGTGASTEISSIDLSVSPVAPAEPIPQDANEQSWNEPTTWDPDGVPTSGNHYTTDLNLITPIGNSDFPGDSLSVFTGGFLEVQGINNFVATIDKLIMEGGSIIATRGAGVTAELAGGLLVNADTTIGNSSNTNNIRIQSLVSGSAKITSTAPSPSSGNELRVTNSSNNFVGTWISHQGSIVFENAGAVGLANVEVESDGGLTILGNWDQASAGAVLTVVDSPNADVDLGTYDWHVASMFLGATEVPQGSHDTATLNGMSDAVFTGSGTLTVGFAPIPQDANAADWDNAPTWNPDGVPWSAFDYTTDMNLYSPINGVPFDGNSLTVLPGGNLHARCINTYIATVPNLIMAGGSIVATRGVDSTNMLDGSLTINADTVIRDGINNGSVRNIRILSNITGTGRITSSAVNSDSTHELQIVNQANDFSGTWVSQRGTIVFENAEAIGSSNIEVQDRGGLIIHGDWNQAGNGASLTVADSANAHVDMGTYQWNLSELKIGDLSLGEDSYTVAELNAYGNAVFTGSGTIQVTPLIIELPTLAYSTDWETNTITFSWADIDFRLQMQNDGLLSDQWIDHPDGASSPVVHSFDLEGHPSAFFRLMEK